MVLHVEGEHEQLLLMDLYAGRCRGARLVVRAEGDAAPYAASADRVPDCRIQPDHGLVQEQHRRPAQRRRRDAQPPDHAARVPAEEPIRSIGESHERRAPRAAADDEPPTWAVLAAGGSRVVSIVIAEVFPAPFGPSSPKTSPASVAMDRSSTAINDPERRSEPTGLVNAYGATVRPRGCGSRPGPARPRRLRIARTTVSRSWADRRATRGASPTRVPLRTAVNAL